MHGTRKAHAARLIIFFVIIGLVALFTELKTCASPRTKAPKTPAERLQVVNLPKGTPEIKKNYTGFTVSFNPKVHMPNYVAWELTRDEVNGTCERVSNFQADESVRGCASLADYKRSGFDRGHMAPAADFKWSPKAMEDTHYLTNICPQTHKMNSGIWNTIEEKSRKWARRDSAVIIIAGPILTDYMPRSIGKSEIPVPERYFKVVFSPHRKRPQMVAFIVGNNESRQDWTTLVTTVDAVEALTGYDFFSELPDDVEAELERTSKLEYWL